MKDYYEILGLSKNANDEDIKKAHRKLVTKWHPDKWVNGTPEEKKAAEEKIKEINEAYAVLSDKDKRRQYDMFGTTDETDGGGFNPFDRFRDMGGFDDDFDPFMGFGRRHRRVERGTDILAEVVLTMAESYSGVKGKTITIKKKNVCEKCHGTGAENGGKKQCPHCNGTGKYVKVNRNGNTLFQQITPCPHCGGSGEIIENPCPECHGTGFVENEQVITIDIPAGIFNDAQMIVPGKGNPPRTKDGVNGDLHIVFTVKDDAVFRRSDLDLVRDLDLTLLEAWDGCKKEVELVDGSKIKITVPKGSRDGNHLRARGKGFKNPNDGRQVGDFIAVVRYAVPNKITDRQRKLLEDFYSDFEK